MTRKPLRAGGERPVSPMVGRGPGPAVGRRARERGARAGATCAACCALAASPTAGAARSRCSRAASSARRPRSRRRCSPGPAIDEGHRKARRAKRCCSSSSPSCSAALLVWLMTYVQTYLVGWVGQRALADLRIRIFDAPAVAADRLLREPPGGRADLAHDQRRRGARQPRDRLGRDAVPVRPDPDRDDRASCIYLDAKLALLTFVRAAAAAARLALVPDRLGRRLPPHARDDRRDHRRPAGERSRACASCAASRQERAPPSTASPRSTATTATRT